MNGYVYAIAHLDFICLLDAAIAVLYADDVVSMGFLLTVGQE
jgi:hypothetical protein